MYSVGGTSATDGSGLWLASVVMVIQDAVGQLAYHSFRLLFVVVCFRLFVATPTRLCRHSGSFGLVYWAQETVS